MARGHQGRRLHHPHQRRAALRPDARRSGREDARRARHRDQADHRPPRPRQAVRRRHGPRADRAAPGQVGNQGRHRHHQHQHLRRQHRRRRPRRRCWRSTRRPAASRSAMSSTCAPTRAACSTRRSRSATPSSNSGEIVSQRGREKDDIERYYARPGDMAHGLPVDRPGRCRQRVGGGDRRRSAAGSPPRAGHGREELRQGLGPDRRPDRSAERAAADHRALLHAVGQVGSGRRDRSRHRRAADCPTPITRTGRGSREADLRRHLLAPGQGRRQAARGGRAPPIRASR